MLQKYRINGFAQNLGCISDIHQTVTGQTGVVIGQSRQSPKLLCPILCVQICNTFPYELLPIVPEQISFAIPTAEQIVPNSFDEMRWV